MNEIIAYVVVGVALFTVAIILFLSKRDRDKRDRLSFLIGDREEISYLGKNDLLTVSDSDGKTNLSVYRYDYNKTRGKSFVYLKFVGMVSFDGLVLVGQYNNDLILYKGSAEAEVHKNAESVLADTGAPYQLY